MTDDEQKRKDYNAYLDRLATFKERRYPNGKIRPLVRKTLKINRNHPCPCGSQLKFKFCCINKKS